MAFITCGFSKTVLDHFRRLAALKGAKTLAELALELEVHATQISEWKQQLLEHAPDAFGGAGRKPPEPDIKAMHAKIGQFSWHRRMIF